VPVLAASVVALLGLRGPDGASTPAGASAGDTPMSPGDDDEPRAEPEAA